MVLIAFLLIITGCINSIATKFQDNQCVRDCDGPEPILFEQPVLQTLQMFVGESTVVSVILWQRYFKRKSYAPLISSVSVKPKLTGKNSFILALPSICDICGTTLMNLALTMIPVSIYQMTRGVLILFVALFSIWFLNRKISRFEWCSLLLVIFGVVLVGYSGNSGNSGVSIDVSFVLGVFLVALGQICTATQFVLEEHIMSKWVMDPVSLVAYEGAYGSLITVVSMTIAHLTFASENKNSSFNLVQAFRDMFSNDMVLYSSIVIMLSIACFNFSGITITNNLNATVRSTVDTLRTLLVWLVSLSLGWETFKLTQFNGFVILVFGTLLFNGAIEIDKNRLPHWLAKDYPQSDQDRVIDVVDEEVERF